MAKALTETDRQILDHLHSAGPLTTREVGRDLDDIGQGAYGQLMRLYRLGHVTRFQLGNSTPVLWSVNREPAND